MTVDYSQWGKLRRRVEQAVCHKLRNNQTDGMTRVMVVLYLDASGTLKGWEEPDCRRLEPSHINWCEELGG